MYVATLYLHSNSHHNLWKWLEVNPITMVYVIYITNLGMVDGMKWGVSDHIPLTTQCLCTSLLYIRGASNLVRLHQPCLWCDRYRVPEGTRPMMIWSEA
jgi:hypothetical protein